MKKSSTQWRGLVIVSFALSALCAPNAWACEGPSDQTFSSAYALIQAGSLEAAQAQLESLLSPNFSQPEVLNNLAAIAHLKGDTAQTLHWLNKAASVRPTYASILNNLALLSKKNQAAWAPLQLISGLPCKPARFTAMTLAEGKAYVAPPTKIPPYDIDVLSLLALPSDLSQDQSPANARQTVSDKGVQYGPLSLAVRAWAAAWRRQSPKDYLHYYASSFDFSSTGAKNRAQWELLRTKSLTRYQRIELELSGVQMLTLDPDLAQVSFHQRWRANAKTTLESRKVMTWKFEGGRWLIVAEHAKDLHKP